MRRDASSLRKANGSSWPDAAGLSTSRGVRRWMRPRGKPGMITLLYWNVMSLGVAQCELETSNHHCIGVGAAKACEADDLKDSYSYGMIKGFV
ncbi:hypothetical protein EVAR_101765_1 [Eumeta japonica]|uniref:Uncharacterized protein n=1 Tax=Eumeta variegata TaxID=151549 RepID=A0A4C1SPX4_EUMVA|nr:hypothetical protein EVAR_101765_1 [Eumeta japonica]